MVSFIRKGNEITTQMGCSFKTKSTKSKATFIPTPMEKHLAVHFTKEYFSGQFADKKVSGLVAKYLLAGDTSQVSIFFLANDKNE